MSSKPKLPKTPNQRVMLRIPEVMVQELDAAARRAFRTRNAEVILRISEYQSLNGAGVESTSEQEMFVLRRFRQMSEKQRAGLVDLLTTAEE